MDRSVFTLTLPSDMRMLSVARNFIEAVCLACELERRLLHSLVLATGEAFTNIVRHAHRDLTGAEVQMRLELDADGVILTFFDQGEPFDLQSVPHLPPGEVRVGGRGVFLLRTLMDDVTCRMRDSAARGNALRMVKRRALAPRQVG